MITCLIDPFDKGANTRNALLVGMDLLGKENRNGDGNRRPPSSHSLDRPERPDNHLNQPPDQPHPNPKPILNPSIKTVSDSTRQSQPIIQTAPTNHLHNNPDHANSAERSTISIQGICTGDHATVDHSANHPDRNLKTPTVPTTQTNSTTSSCHCVARFLFLPSEVLLSVNYSCSLLQ